MALAQLDIYQMALRFLADARLSLITDDVESRYALDDGWKSAPTFVLRQAPWRFALRTSNLTTGGTVINGYTNSVSLPGDWLRTHAVFLVGALNGREFPFDFREQGSALSYNLPVGGLLNIRYVATLFIDPAFAPWPEQFAECVAAYLAFLVAERVTGDRNAAGKMSQLFASLLPQAIALDAIDEDPWLEHQRNGSYLRVARTMIDQGFWRFAMKTALLTTGPSTNGGFSTQVAVPADWSRTRSLYVLTTDKAPTGAGERRPFKVREQAGFWYSDQTSFYVEYVSATLAMDSTQWPDHYMRAVLRELEYDKSQRHDSGKEPPTYGRDEQLRAGQGWKDALADTADSEAIAPDPWLAYQLDGSFEMAARAVLVRGYWWWAIKDLQIDTSTQETTNPAYGLPYRYALPADWLNTYALFVPFDGLECPVNIRETNADWSTDAPSFVARYLSTDVLDPTTWPEAVAHAIRAYADAQDDEESDDQKSGNKAQVEFAAFEKLLADALKIYSLPEHPWLRFQLDGRYQEAVKKLLEHGRWRFAVKTATLTDPNNPSAISLDPNAQPPTVPVPGDPAGPYDTGAVSSGYSCRMIKPNDWLRTLQLYFSLGDGVRPLHFGIDYRDELDAFHANYTPLQLRYVSRIGLDSTRWPMQFRVAALAWLEHLEARADPKLAAVAATKLKLFEEACREAEELDDERDVPRVNRTGRFVAGRLGRGNVSREQGWPPISGF